MRGLGFWAPFCFPKTGDAASNFTQRWPESFCKTGGTRIPLSPHRILHVIPPLPFQSLPGWWSRGSPNAFRFLNLKRCSSTPPITQAKRTLSEVHGVGGGVPPLQPNIQQKTFSGDDAKNFRAREGGNVQCTLKLMVISAAGPNRLFVIN